MQVANVLLMPFQLTRQTCLRNRVVMPPMTRCMAQDHIPTDEMAEYYGKRGAAGLVISESTMVHKTASGYSDAPGIFNADQVKGWQNVAQKVHEKGSQFFMQLWHAGAMSHPEFRQGQMAIAPSTIVPGIDSIPRTNGRLKYLLPRAMNQSDINDVIEMFREAAKNAIQAGCDGVEIHAGNGYLLDSFLHFHTNKRQDDYGGSAINMCRFVLEVVDAIIKEIGSEKVAIRLSPVPIPSMKNMQESPGDIEVFITLLQALEQRNIAFVHVATDDDILESGSLGMPVSQFIRKHYRGNLIGCGGYTLESATQAISEGRFDLISFGKLFIANPDLLEKIAYSQPLTSYHPDLLNQLI